MIDELINLKTRNLLEGKDILAQVKSCREIKGSNSSIYEVELLNIDSFRESQDDIAFLDSITSSNNNNQNLNEKPVLPLFILKEIVGVSLKDEIKLVKVMKSFPTKIPGFIYLLGYAVYKTDALEVAYVLMERGDSNLQKYIESRAANGDHITCSEYISIIQQTISTLAEMQAAKIAHNDIKPANILVMNRTRKKKSDLPTISKEILNYGNNSPQVSSNPVISTTLIKEGDISPAIMISEVFFSNKDHQKQENESDMIIVKLCDIGSGQTNANTEKTAEQRGTVQYMAPEILQQSKNRINIYKQDVFSLGLCFVFIVLQKTSNYHLSLRPPMKDLVSAELALNIFKEVLQEWIHAIGSKMNNSEAIVKILSRMLSIEISERPDFIELKEICKELFCLEENHRSNYPIEPLNSANQQNNIIPQEAGGSMPTRWDTLHSNNNTENHKEVQSIQKSPSRSIQNGDIYISKPKSISLAQEKKRTAPSELNFLNVPSYLQYDSVDTKTSSEDDKSNQNSPMGQRILTTSKPLVASQFAQSPSVSKISRQLDAVSSPHSNNNESKLPGSSIAQRRKYTQQQEKKPMVHLGPPLAELAQSILLGPDFKQIVPQKSNSKGNSAGNLTKLDPITSKPTITNSKDLATSSSTSRAFIISTPSQKFMEQQATSHQKNKPQLEQSSINASKQSLQSDSTISEPTSVFNLTKQKINSTSQQMLFNNNNSSNLNTSIGFNNNKFQNTKVSFHENNTILDQPTTRKNNINYSRKTPSSPQLKLPIIVNQSRPGASQYSSQFNLAQGEISRRDISELERSILMKDKNNSKLNLSPQVRTKSFQGVFDSEESAPPSPQQQSRNQNSGSPQMKSVQQKSTFSNKSKPSNHIKSIFGPFKQQSSVQQTKSVPHWNINDQIQNTNSLPILDFSTSSMSSISKTLSKSSKSLNEAINDRFESVFASDYQEIYKFSEHFGMLGDKSQKHLTILFKGQDRNLHYGFAEILSRLFGIVHLTIIFSQQLKETIDWVFDCLSSISQSLQDLTIIFRDCNYSQNSNNSNKGSSSEFGKPSDNWLAKNLIIPSKLYLNLRLEGKIIGTSEMLESFAKKVISTQPRISTVSLVNQQKSSDVFQGITQCLSALQKYSGLQNLGVELSQSLLNQQNIANLLQIIEPFQSLHNLSLNLSSNPIQLDKLFCPSFPLSLHTLFLNLSGVYLSSVELVKLTKALKSCSHLTTLHLYLNSSFRKNQQNQLMLFLPDAMMLAKHTTIIADSNNLTDADFNTYQSDLLIPFEIETLVLSFSKNSLSLISFKILSQMIKCQQKLKKVIINFPLTILKSQAAQEFMNDSSNQYIVNSNISDYETITIQIEIKQQHMKLQQRKSFKTHTRIEENQVKHMCSNFSKDCPYFEGSFCATCYEKHNCISSDSLFCSHCIETCHQGHVVRQIFEFPSSSILCSCKDIPECCLTYQQLENNNNSVENLSPLKLSVPV